MINIAVINESTSVSNQAVQGMLPAFTTQWNRDLAPAWGLDSVTFTVVPKGQAPAAGSWWLVWLDDSDQADALAYHDLTDEGLPLSKVFVKTIQADGASLTVAATHELCEMAVDPTINLAAQDQSGTFWAYECADPVEDDQYGYDINDIRVTDFLLPSWFGYKSSKGPYDFARHCTDAFQVLSGGYAQQFGAQGWTQVNGRSVKKPKARTAPDGSRRERRERGTGDFSRSRPRGR
ncbi:MAG TPA: hypothetical protein VI456_09635 [Polyangia bacterium]